MKLLEKLEFEIGGFRLGNESILLKNKMPSDTKVIQNNCDVALIIGGDGTLLRAAQDLSIASIPICGINRGRLGFLVDISPDHIEENLEKIFTTD